MEKLDSGGAPAPGAPGAGTSVHEERMQKVDAAKEWIDRGLDVFGGFATNGTDVADAVYSQQSSALNDKNAGSDWNAGIGTATGALQMLSGGYGFARSLHKSKDKTKKGDKVGASMAKYDTASSFFGTLSGAAGMANGISGLSGGSVGLSGALGITSGSMDMIGSGINIGKSVSQRDQYASMQERADEKRKRLEKKKRDSEKAISDLQADGNPPEKRDEIMRARRDRESSDDLLQAISSTKANARAKSESGRAGIFSSALSMLGGLANTGNAIAKMFGPAGKIIGATLGILGTLSKTAGHAINIDASKKENKAIQEANDHSLDAYIEQLWLSEDAHNDHMTKEEARAIVAERLGVPEADAQDNAKMYKALAGRRADRILKMKKENPDRRDVLEAMGIDPDAEVDRDTVMERLGAGG